MKQTSGSLNVSTKLQRIAELARKMPRMALCTLSHHIDIEFLREAYRRTRKDGATGVDEMTADEYGKRIDENLASLLQDCPEFLRLRRMDRPVVLVERALFAGILIYVKHVYFSINFKVILVVAL